MTPPTTVPSLTHKTSSLPWPIWAMAALALLSLAVVSWQRLHGGPVSTEASGVSWQRSLHFEDRSNGDVAVIDAQGRTEVTRFQGEQGFLRGALRVLARERVRHGLDATEPFVLTGHPDGRLTLSDPATATRISLESFGPSNVAVFASLRHAGRTGDRP